ncbi:sulfoacetaldehyde dehydrogenase [Variovorax paradoxus]|jgi:sulfoacetaldehyde dehydrogenase|uniref:acylating sulfoacetaldehyde dehydrogenase n=1 Tax=Variovorax paradoxus TaxID=34073 RepID=UPI0006E5A214|nr:sulfoacetaldehyde dehydrogenase [Variovorax paradoxus]KPU96120.1 sulfoacetaldehyde dehydrogenase [Variovorax paradoxus]KPV01357.1 sulfoacetaldehyde dehydrogenase [Variovorax paradoxus]KPV17614.1 sulfoacetaldehyde dehydrogenase [Variovorax paradoxus]KPV25746.1 sulfoacetaldehyde dehydrogenase [Variovorax paradoxus]
MNPSASSSEASSPIVDLVARARAAQRIYETWSQAQVDMAVTAAGWAIIEPARNRELAELAVADTGVGNVEDKVRKNHRKTFGLLRDLQGARSVGVIAEDPARGIVEIARPVGVVCAITPSTNPGATPANKIINALKGRNAVIVAPSPKGWSTAARLIEFIHQQFDRIGAPRDLVQLLPAPVNKQSTAELMRLCDLVVATGSQANVRAAYASGTPAFGVGAGNVAGIVDETADTEAAADRIVRSKTFDNATSCSSENSLVVVDAVRARLLSALKDRGAVMLGEAQKAALQQLMWPGGKLSPAVIGQSARAIAERAAEVDGANRAAWQAIAEAAPRILMVAEDGVGHDHPFSGEKLSPVLAVYAARDFAQAASIVERIYGYEGAGHSVGLHSAVPERALELGLTLPVSRVIVDQAHCIATGGSFDNGLPFSLSMGCGTWGRNNFSDNMNYRHYLNITRVSRPIAEQVPSEEQIFGAFFARHGAH